MTKYLEKIRQQAQSLDKRERIKILMSFEETDIHRYLKQLFEKMYPRKTVEITHGSDEYGKDLVMVEEDIIKGYAAEAIIVVKGNIKGKTTGPVDKIKSQVEQAFAHPAKLKTIPQKIEISGVVVIIIGEISKNAQERLEKELKSFGRNLYIHGLNTVVDWFTNYYPQVFFVPEVINFFHKKFEGLETKHFFYRKGKNLSECFVEPWIAKEALPQFDEENVVSFIKKQFKRQKFPFSQLSLPSSHKKIMLVGGPGTGKSTCLAKLALDMLKEAYNTASHASYEKSIKVPILIEARKLLKVDDVEQLKDMYYIKDRCEVNVLMVDALDEVSPSYRNHVLKRSEEFSEKLNSSLIITTRKIEIVKEFDSRFQRYELLPFEFSQALKLLRKLVKDKTLLEVLKDGLEKIKFQIPMVPLTLALLVDLVEQHKEVPASITELYNEFSDLVLGKLDKEKGIEVLFEYHIKKRFLAELAFKEFLQKDKLEISLEDYEIFLDDYATKYGWEKEKLNQFVEEIRRVGILSFKEQKAFFTHRSFLDYFAAFYIFEKREEFKGLEREIVKYYFHDIWEDVAFFYIGLKKEISKGILNKIFNFGENKLSIEISKLLTGRLLQAGWNSPIKIKEKGIKKGISFAPLIREKLLKMVEKEKVKVPKILIDFFIIFFCEVSYSSGFLFEPIRTVFKETLKDPSKDAIFVALYLLTAIRRLLDFEELKIIINEILGKLSELEESKEDQARILVILELIDSETDGSFKKVIRGRLKRLVKKHPHVFKELFPQKRKGFRE